VAFDWRFILTERQGDGQVTDQPREIHCRIHGREPRQTISPMIQYVSVSVAERCEIVPRDRQTIPYVV